MKLAEQIDLDSLVTHRPPLSEIPTAYRVTANYEPGLIQTLIVLS